MDSKSLNRVTLTNNVKQIAITHKRPFKNRILQNKKIRIKKNRQKRKSRKCCRTKGLRTTTDDVLIPLFSANCRCLQSFVHNQHTKPAAVHTESNLCHHCKI